MSAGEKALHRGRRAVMVLGMHRSGTSAFTRVINLLGAELPTNLLPANPAENATGFWESSDIIQCHDQFLTAIGSSWDDVHPLPADVFAGAPAQHCRADLQTILTRDFQAARLIVLKDPRLCRLLPLWQPVLANAGFDAVAVLPVRNPLEAAQSLTKRNGFSLEMGLALWLRHFIAAERHSRGMRRVFVSYDRLLAAPEEVTRQLAKAIEVADKATIAALPSIQAFASTNHRHHKVDDQALMSDSHVSTWVRDCYALALAATRGETIDTAALERIADNLAAGDRLFGPLLAQEAKRRGETDRRLGEMAAELTAAQASTEAERAAAQSSIEAERTAAENKELQHRLNTALQASLNLDDIKAKLTELQCSLSAMAADTQVARAKTAAQLTALQERLAVVMAKPPSPRARLAHLTGLNRLTALATLLRYMAPAVFDTATYRKQWPEAASSRLPAALHYLLRGRRHGASPTPLFDPLYYGARNPDVAAAGHDPFFHYIQHGWREGRKPSPLFDPLHYLEQNPDVRRQRVEPLLHYLKHGWHEGRSPNPLFDVRYYLADGTVSGEPVSHFLRHGARARKNPGPLFDVQAYLDENSDIADAGDLNPLAHYLDHGEVEGRPCPVPGATGPIILDNRATKVVLQVLHGLGGGVERHCHDLGRLLSCEGVEVWSLQGIGSGNCRLSCQTLGVERTYRLPSGENALLADLRTVAPDHVHVHHIIGFGRRLWDWIGTLGVAYDVTVHDYAFVCPRVTMLDGRHRYCAEEDTAAACDLCVERFGTYPHLQALYDEFGGTASWRDYWQGILSNARRVFVPDEDVAHRFSRHLKLSNLRTKPHPEPKARIPTPAMRPSAQIKVAIIGNIGHHKGFHILRACAELAQRERQPLHFVVFGNVAAPRELAKLGTVTLPGTYHQSELRARLMHAGCHVAAFLSVWPETFTYT